MSELQTPYPPRAARHRSKASPLRVVIGVMGELLITAALILALFVFWQLYWTTWQVEGKRDEAVRQWELTVPKVSQDVDKGAVAVARTDPPPVAKMVGHGEMYGVLHVQQWGMKIPVAEGVSPDVLDQAFAGRDERSDLPGALGNFAISGHRRTNGNNFRRIDILQPGDQLVLQTKDAYLVYKVYEHEIVLPEQVEVLAPVPNHPGEEPTRRLMSLLTCEPEFGNSHRYIQRLELDHWYDINGPKPPELAWEDKQ